MHQDFQLAAVGDVVLTRPFKGRENVDPRFLSVLDLLGGADIAFADLESVLSHSGYPREKLITLGADPELVEDLKQMHFGVLSVANNHTVDFGEDPLLDTIDVLERHDIQVIGAGRNIDAALSPAIVTANGAAVAFLAASCLLPVGSSAAADRPGVAPIHVHTELKLDPYVDMEEPGHPPVVHTYPDMADLAMVCERVEAARATADFVAVSVHMGFGFGEVLAEYQPIVGHALIDAGADIVLGNHVHAIHGIETYQGKAILYSPGNFVAQQPREGQPPEVLAVYGQMSSDAYLALVDVAASGGYELHIIPTIINDEGLPVRAQAGAFERITERVVRLSAMVNTESRVTADAVVIDLRS